ncbi:MAG TPA: GNAT family N-acetyltransferase [Armatimonadota bacterium]|jgi:LmbE family N-acetylglucosaminyl deacetylase/ribosomal protein S18 acetylase RimI-like enzyme
MNSPPEIVIRRATAADLPAVAAVFAAAFPESVDHVAGTLTTDAPLLDVFNLALEAEPEAFRVAELEGRVVGYVLSPVRTSRLRTVAVWRGHLLRGLWSWLTGRYGVRVRALRLALADKISFLRSQKVGEFSDSRILSIAVHPDAQGGGVGRRLLEAGLEYLRQHHVPVVRLEVRPDNPSARHLYEQAGFEGRGTYEDAQGPWLVMTKRRHARPRRARRKRLARWLRRLLLLLFVAWSAWGFSYVIINRPAYLANMRLRLELPFMPLPGPGERVLIFAPHPDDEVIGCGGLIQECERSGAQVTVVLMTSGDASELGLLFAENAVRRSPSEYLRLGKIRLQESAAALATLGVPADRLVTLGYPNGGLDLLWTPDYWLPEHPYTSTHTRVNRSPYANSYTPQALYCGQQVLADVGQLLEQVRPDYVFTTGPFDVHPDHWATYDFVKLALLQRAVTGRKVPRLYSFLVHHPDWPTPPVYRPREALQPPAALAAASGLKWYALPLTGGEVKLKAEALRQYHSQRPFWDLVLAALVRRNELMAEVGPDRPCNGLLALTDPRGEATSLRRRPGADIASLLIFSRPEQWRFSINLMGPASPAVTYSLLGHALDARGAVSVWSCNRRAGGTLVTVQGDALNRSALTWTSSGTTLTTTLPAAVAQNRALLLEAITRSNRRYLDHTVTRAVLETPLPAPLVAPRPEAARSPLE